MVLKSRNLRALVLVLLFSGCASIGYVRYEERYAPPSYEEEDEKIEPEKGQESRGYYLYDPYYSYWSPYWGWHWGVGLYWWDPFWYTPCPDCYLYYYKPAPRPPRRFRTPGYEAPSGGRESEPDTGGSDYYRGDRGFHRDDSWTGGRGRSFTK